MSRVSRAEVIDPAQVEDAEVSSTALGKAHSGRRNLWLNLVKILVSAGLMGWLLWDTNLNEIFAAMLATNLLLVTIAGAMHLLGFTISAMRWRRLLRVHKMDASIIYLIKSYLVGMFFNNFLPSTIGGDAVRAYDSWQLGQSKSRAIAVIFVDRFLGLLALILFAITAAFFTEQLTADIPLLNLWLLLGLAGMSLIIGFIFIPFPWLTRKINDISLPYTKKIKQLANAFLSFQGHRQALFSALGLSILLQTNVIVHYYLIAQALSLPVPLHSFFLIIPIVTVVMMLPVSVNAIGLRENAFVFFLAFYGVTKPEAVAFAWIAYGLILFQGLLGGMLYALRR